MSQTHDQTYYYFTMYADGNKIDTDAKFQRAKSIPEMISSMQGNCAGEVIAIDEGEFSDCWAKITIAPTDEDFEYWSIQFGLPKDCFIVRAPGTHPGGNFYWIDLSIPIYVPVIKC